MKKLYILLFSLVALILPTTDQTSALADDYVVIVNLENPQTTVSKSNVSKLLLKRTSRWDDDTPALPIDLDSRSPVRESFSRDVHGRSVASIKSYWQRQIFSGKSVPPPEASNDADVVQFVASNRGAIGYVSGNANVAGVKVVTLSN